MNYETEAWDNYDGTWTVIYYSLDAGFAPSCNECVRLFYV